jgi:NitT/TauT family transport system permease protein
MFSKEHLLFLKKEKKYHRWVVFTQISILFFFLIGWQILADYKIINTFITSSPKMVLHTIINLVNENNLFYHIGITVYETIISFSVGTILGILIATIMWWNPFIRKVIDPYLTVLNSLPKVALGPIIIVWCGARTKSIILMALFISVIVMIMTVIESFENVDSNKLKLMKVLKASKSQIFFKLVLPSSYKSIISALKICISMSLIGVIMGEFLVSKAGVGYLIMYGSQIFNLNLVVSGIIILAFLSWIMYSIIYYIEKKLTH